MSSRKKRKPDFEGIAEKIRRELVDQSLPSLALAVSRDGEFLREEAWGWANREQRIPATPHTMYSLASISKPITATALMILVERGQIDLDVPLNEYLGDTKLKAWVGDAADATVRRVASHTSGLHLHYQFFYEDEPHRRPPMDETIRRYGHLVAPPGERHYYSNFGYGLLDHLIARISGQSYAEFLRREVFLPLGMTRASVDLAPGLEAYAAERYGSDGLAYPFYDFDHPGGSAVYCSAHDLVRFGLLHLDTHLPDQKAILSEESIREMQTPVQLNDSSSCGYGIGWRVEEDDNGYRSVSHGGGMGGVNTILKLIPTEEIAVAVLCNAGTSLPFQIADDLIGEMLPDFAKERNKREKERETERDENSPTVKPSFEPPPDLLDEWKGSIHTGNGDLPFTLRIKEDGDVHAQIESNGQLKALVNNVRFKDGLFTGVMVGDLGTEDTNRRPYKIRLELKRRGDRLNGAAIAVSESYSEAAPGKRCGNALSHWTEVKKVDEP
ncbi:MAG: beta-lactamase family protein [Armatimonadetes bacterium]|nr:beta-lactamase family protein [Armatimonadota bacterium]